MDIDLRFCLFALRVADQSFCTNLAASLRSKSGTPLQVQGHEQFLSERELPRPDRSSIFCTTSTEERWGRRELVPEKGWIRHDQVQGSVISLEYRETLLPDTIDQGCLQDSNSWDDLISSRRSQWYNAGRGGEVAFQLSEPTAWSAGGAPILGLVHAQPCLDLHPSENGPRRNQTNPRLNCFLLGSGSENRGQKAGVSIFMVLRRGIGD
ncbi:hypothetical protein BDZ91DRAFT_782848 [Kalaharituber pfeilii]|nr:hypothetical protein BDZ91DRAFT_782848 [Kalaharituber pfeilii]